METDTPTNNPSTLLRHRSTTSATTVLSHGDSHLSAPSLLWLLDSSASLGPLAADSHDSAAVAAAYSTALLSRLVSFRLSDADAPTLGVWKEIGVGASDCAIALLGQIAQRLCSPSSFCSCCFRSSAKALSLDSLRYLSSRLPRRSPEMMQPLLGMWIIMRHSFPLQETWDLLGAPICKVVADAVINPLAAVSNPIELCPPLLSGFVHVDCVEETEESGWRTDTNRDRNRIDSVDETQEQHKLPFIPTAPPFVDSVMKLCLNCIELLAAATPSNKIQRCINNLQMLKKFTGSSYSSAATTAATTSSASITKDRSDTIPSCGDQHGSSDRDNQADGTNNRADVVGGPQVRDEGNSQGRRGSQSAPENSLSSSTLHPLDAACIALSYAMRLPPFAPTRSTVSVLHKTAASESLPALALPALWLAAVGLRPGRRSYCSTVLHLVEATLSSGSLARASESEMEAVVGVVEAATKMGQLQTQTLSEERVPNVKKLLAVQRRRRESWAEVRQKAAPAIGVDLRHFPTRQMALQPVQDSFRPLLALLDSPKSVLESIAERAKAEGKRTSGLVFRTPLYRFRNDLVPFVDKVSGERRVKTQGGVRVLTIDTSLGVPADISHLYSLLKLERVSGLPLGLLVDLVVCTSLSALWMTLILVGLDVYSVYVHVSNVYSYVFKDSKSNIKRIAQTAGRERYSDKRFVALLDALFGGVKLKSALAPPGALGEDSKDTPTSSPTDTTCSVPVGISIATSPRLPVICYVAQDVSVNGVVLATSFGDDKMEKNKVYDGITLGDTVSISAPSCSVVPCVPCPVETFSDAIRACAASPTTLAPLRIRGFALTDGGFSISNYVATACLLARAIFARRTDVVVDVSVRRRSTRPSLSLALQPEPAPPSVRGPAARPDIVNILTWGANAVSIALLGHRDRDAGLRVAQALGVRTHRLAEDANGIANISIDAAAKDLAASMFYVEDTLPKPSAMPAGAEWRVQRTDNSRLDASLSFEEEPEQIYEVPVGSFSLFVVSRHRLPSVPRRTDIPVNTMGVGVPWVPSARDVDAEMLLESQHSGEAIVVPLRPGGLLDAQVGDFSAVAASVSNTFSQQQSNGQQAMDRSQTQQCGSQLDVAIETEETSLSTSRKDADQLLCGAVRRFRLSCCLTRSGTFLLSIRYRDCPISGMPIGLVLLPGAPSLASSFVPPHNNPQLNELLYVQVALVDSYGNHTTRTDNLVVSVRRKARADGRNNRSSSLAQTCSDRESSDVDEEEPVSGRLAVYRNLVFVAFIPKLEGSYLCSATINGAHIASSPMLVEVFG